MAAIQLLTDQQHMNIWIPWCEAPGKWQGSLLYNLVSVLLDTIERIAGYEIAHYTIVGSTKCEHMVQDFARLAIKSSSFGDTFSYGESVVAETREHSAEYLHVTRKNDKLEKTLANATEQFSKTQKMQSIA